MKQINKNKTIVKQIYVFYGLRWAKVKSVILFIFFQML